MSHVCGPREQLPALPIPGRETRRSSALLSHGRFQHTSLAPDRVNVVDIYVHVRGEVGAKPCLHMSTTSRAAVQAPPPERTPDNRAVLPPGESRHLPDCGLRSDPSACCCHLCPPALLQSHNCTRVPVCVLLPMMSRHRPKRGQRAVDVVRPVLVSSIGLAIPQLASRHRLLSHVRHARSPD